MINIAFALLKKFFSLLDHPVHRVTGGKRFAGYIVNVRPGFFTQTGIPV
jgi:hypothetical protein